MKPALISFALLVMLTACEKQEARVRPLSDEGYRKLSQSGPATGRAEFVSPVELLPDPAKYNGRRVILAGIWSSGFEHSLFNVENSAQDFWIWVDVDWPKIDGPAGDFSRRNENRAKLDHNGHVSYRILAEGTFYYRDSDYTEGPTGFGHMGVCPAYFIIDRLFQFDPVDEEPDKPAKSRRAKSPSGGTQN